MTIIQEGTLQFTFNAPAEACKYDGWSFYRSQFQDGCYSRNKAVDLLCYSGTDAWLIEVKDYRLHARTKAVNLADEIANKVRDSLAGLVAAQMRASSADERQFARRMLRTTNIRVVCHVEQPAKTSRLRPQAIEPDKLKGQLRQRLKAIDPHPMVMDAASVPLNVPWRVA